MCEKSFANKFFEKLFAKIFFEKSLNFYRKANVDHQVLVVGGLGANLVEKQYKIELISDFDLYLVANLVEKCKIEFIINTFDLYLVGNLVGKAS